MLHLLGFTISFSSQLNSFRLIPVIFCYFPASNKNISMKEHTCEYKFYVDFPFAALCMPSEKL